MKRISERLDQGQLPRELRSARREHPLAWVWEPLEFLPTFELRSMFGAKTAYVGGDIMLGFIAKEDPWRGVLVCTDRNHHASLMSDMPALSPHPVLSKWLMLREDEERFEQLAGQLVRLVLQRDPRIGVKPKPKKRRKS